MSPGHYKTRRALNPLLFLIASSVILVGCSSNSNLAIVTHPIAQQDSPTQVLNELSNWLSSTTWQGNYRFETREISAGPIDLVGRLLIGDSSTSAAQTSAALASGATAASTSLLTIIPSGSDSPQGGISIEVIQFSSKINSLRFSKSVESRHRGTAVSEIANSQSLSVNISDDPHCGTDCFGESVLFPAGRYVIIMNASCSFESCNHIASDLAQSVNGSITSR